MIRCNTQFCLRREVYHAVSLPAMISYLVRPYKQYHENYTGHIGNSSPKQQEVPEFCTAVPNYEYPKKNDA